MIKRNILNKLQEELTQPGILILLGPRQVGKTTLLRALDDYARHKSLRTAFFDLEQPQALADFNRPDKGVILESFVFLRLNAQLMPNMEIKFWRTKDAREVDFILLKDRKPIPIEVKSKIASAEIPSGLKRFLNRYPDVKLAYVINEQIEEEVKHGGCLINFLTFEEFSKHFLGFSLNH